MTDSRPLASSHLVTFLYKLVRDHLPFGAVEQLVDSIEGNAFLQHRLSESHVAAWAESVAARLTSDSTLAIREYARRGGGDTTIIRVPLTQLPDWARAAFEESTGEESPLDQRLAEADALIKELCEHEGAEGWSADLRRRLDRYDARYLAARPDPMTFELDSEGHLNAVDGGSITLTEVSPQSPTESSRSEQPLGEHHRLGVDREDLTPAAQPDDNAPATDGSFPLLRLFELLRASDSSSRMKERVFMGWQGNTAAPVEVKDLVERLGPHLHDLQTHYRGWRDAIRDQLNAATASAEDELFWKHELKTFDRLFVALAGVTVPEVSNAD